MLSPRRRTSIGSSVHVSGCATTTTIATFVVLATMATATATPTTTTTTTTETESIADQQPSLLDRHLQITTPSSPSNTRGGRSWPTLIPKRRTIPPYDAHRYIQIPEWDPFSVLPPQALPSSDRPNFGRPTNNPTSPPTPEGYDILDRLPPTRAPRPTPAPSAGPTTPDDFADACGIDGHGFLSTVTLKDKWGDGWDGTYLTLTDTTTQEPIYTSTLTARDGKVRTDRVCLKVWTCYEVTVTGSQWSDEISWSIDRLDEVGDYFLLSVNRAQDLGLRKQLGYGGANTRCSLALTDVGLMEGCGMTCDGRGGDDSGNGSAGGDVAVVGGNAQANNKRPTRSPTPVPTPAVTISDDFGSYGTATSGGGNTGRQPTVPVGFGGNGGGTAYQRPTSSFPFGFGNAQRPTDPNAPPFDMGNVVTPVRGTPRPTPAPTTAKPTLPPELADAPYRPPGYFNYDPFDGFYGPEAWGKWWPGCGTGVTQFNQAGVGIATSVDEGRQSPIHLSNEGMNVQCEATHEIRTRAAEFSICDEEAGLFSVTPSRLRLDFTAKKQNPETDLPDGFGVMTAKYLEVAYPALHTIEDENGKWRRYDAEYTIVHDFDRREKATLISTLIDATGNKNERFQDLLDEWSKVDACRTAKNEEQFLEQIEQFDQRQLLRATSDTFGRTASAHEAKGRELACAFNIYHRTLMPSTYYYAYQGSMPEPPCTYKDYLPGTSEWRVINKPMKIAPSQLQQLKSLIEQGPCKENEYAQDMGVWRARPVQENDDRPYWQCERQDFPLDCERDGGWCDCDAILCPDDFM
mmetsp:Transcript_23625/g.68013  ORF Transcript_23625/g.68013 Transcript_23625/m.68013 type:complete len:800 (+) Transcript_23625:139-2538(+)